MCNLFALNFAGPSYSSLKRENKKGVKFVAREHVVLFDCISNIYRDAKHAHGIDGPIPLILAKDKTKVMSRIAWETSSDVLVGFCGAKERHCCVSSFKPIVGSGQTGYEAIVDTFYLSKKGSFARVTMVNHLHDKLPRLVLVVSYTYNCFDSTWIRK